MDQQSSTIQTKTSVAGKIVAVVFHNPQNKYTVLKIKDYKRSLVGNIDNPLIGETVTFVGVEGTHTKYGPQFQFHAYQRVVPSDTEHIYEYIVKVAKWVGPHVGKDIIEHYGNDTLDVLKNEPERVAEEIKHVSSNRAKEMSDTLKENEMKERLFLELGRICSGILSPALVDKIVRRYGSSAVDVIKKNPYELMSIRRITFPYADAIAHAVGIQRFDERRHAAALVSVLAAKYGDTKVPFADVARATRQLLGMELSHEGVAYAVAKSLVVKAGGAFALRNYYDAEISIAFNLFRLIRNAKHHTPEDVDFGECYADQLEAINLIKENPVTILTGPPGTGKTWVLGTFIQGYIEAGYNVMFCAPTGKAAKRMTEVLHQTCGKRATTIHKLLQMVPPNDDSATWTYQFTASNPIDADYIVVDEVSMLDINLASALFEAIADGARLLLIGDDNQLPSVGPGSVLRDLIAANLPTARLSEIKRNHGDIVVSCHQIKDGKVPLPNPEPLDISIGHNWAHVELTSEDALAKYIVTLVTELVNGGVDLADIMVISPFNHMNPRGLSCKDFNERLQRVLNPIPDLTVGDLNINDRVVRLQNAMVKCEDIDDDTMIVNGDLGDITDIKFDQNGYPKHYIVRFYEPERLVRLDAEAPELALAYALSCHKMQGSESLYIILPIHKSFGRFPNREWIYTAFSRAKTTLFTVGMHSILYSWISRQGNALRVTGLLRIMELEKQACEDDEDGCRYER